MNLIVAADRNWGIGCNNALLASIPGDMKYFKEHQNLSFWPNMNMPQIAPELFLDNETVMRSYD